MYNGIINIKKEAGYTSVDVVALLRGIFGQRKIGHTGTLDPQATGVLPVCLGTATKICDLLTDKDKEYVAELLLGVTTDTQDITGKILLEKKEAVSALEPERVKEIIMGFVGEYDQIPPMYSASKVKGQKLYEIARRGGEVERKPRAVTISRLELLGQEDGDWLLDVCCSKGTYVRTLCHDIGQALGCGGCMSGLRRLEAGAFSLENAYTLPQVQQTADEGRAAELLLPVDALFPALSPLTLAAPEEKRLRSGSAFPCEAPEGSYRAYSEAGEFLALGRVRAGRFQTIKSFFEV